MNNTLNNNRICIGKIADAHGVRGLIKVSCYAEDPGLLNAHDLYTDENGDQTIKITLKNPANKYWIASVAGVNDRNAAENLKGTALWLDRDLLPDTDDDEFYYSDLEGMNVQNPDGEVIGTILAIQNFGAGDLLEIKPVSGASYYLPFTKEFVPTIDIENEKIILIVPEDLPC